jgi:hypothetical protein
MNGAALTDFFTFFWKLEAFPRFCGTSGRCVPAGTQRHDEMGMTIL